MRLYKFWLFPLFVGVIVNGIGSSQNNETGRGDSLVDEEIPLKVILDGVRELTAKRAEQKSVPVTDASDSDGLDLKKTLVGVKQHRNYEIVLYEYSDEEDLPENEGVVDVSESAKDGKSRQRVRFQGPSSTSPSQNATTTNEQSTLNNSSSFSQILQTTYKTKYDRSMQRIFLPVSVPISNKDNPKVPEDTPFTWGRQQLQTGSRIGPVPDPVPERNNAPKHESAEPVESPKPNQNRVALSFHPQVTPPPFVREIVTTEEEATTTTTTIAPLPRTESPQPHPSFPPTTTTTTESPSFNLPQISTTPPIPIIPFPNHQTQQNYKNNPQPENPPQSSPSTTTPPYRQTIEDAPGAGRFIPRKRPTNSSSSSQPHPLPLPPPPNQHLLLPFLNISLTEEDEEEALALLCTDPKGRPGLCEEYFKCAALYTESSQHVNLQDYKCVLPSSKEIGICCPVLDESLQVFTKSPLAMKSEMMKEMMKNSALLSPQIKNLVKSNVNNSIAFGLDSVIQLEEIENDILGRGEGQVAQGSPAFGHNRFFPTSKKIRQVSEFGFELLQTTNDLSERLHLDNEIGGSGLRSFSSSNTRAINDRCPRPAPCAISKYRTIDGSCNNIRRPKMGQALTPLSRVLEPAYADGRWEPRISIRGFLLPSARLVSQRFIKDRDNPNNKFTLMTMQFGQFVDHDVSSVPVFTFANGSGISCCRNGNFLPPQDRHPNCLPIEIPREDPFYSQFSQKCMNFVRSRMAPRIDCSLGYADQMNAVTHWLDLSNVYGSSSSDLRDLRLFSSGLLRFSELADRRMLLPLKRKPSGDVDYKAGDDRVNEMQGLMVMHLIWLREHNRVALELARINPGWNDETLFQEARRIVIAEYQHILYNEWLPIVVGREYLESYGVLPLSRRAYFRGYDPEVDASIENSFSSAGFRMGHSLVSGVVRLINEFGEGNEAIVVSQHADNARRTRAPNQIDKWIRGLAQQAVQSFDPFVTQHLNGRLFQARGGRFGMDLTALNVQRARDHGIPGYNAFRELCQTGPRARAFDDFKDFIPSDIVDEMKRLYDHVDDVDLYIGGVSELPLKGALLGPTFTCIVGDQFARSKRGDRYFYDIADQTHSFSPAQLQEIRKSSMARILCDNSDELEAIQPSVFLQSDFDFNALVDCRRSRRIPRVNLQLWENEPAP